MGEERVGFPSDFLFFWLLLFGEKKKKANDEEGVYIACCSHLQEVEAAKRKSCKM